MKNKILRTIAVFMAVNMLTQLVAPMAAFALTGGPSQAEVQSFEPVGTTEMVDLFSGDFNYNIPLMDVEGYPINIAYHSGATMDQEASWVGLGWNINPGVINRNMRGLPDDFNGDMVKKDQYIKKNYTFSLGPGPSFELLGLKMLNIGLSLNVFYNNYKGIGFSQNLGASFSSRFFALRGDISSNTQSGMELSWSAGVGIAAMAGENSHVAMSFGGGQSVNTRTGVKTLSFDKGLSVLKRVQSEDGSTRTSTISSGNSGSTVSYANESYIPQITMAMSNFSASMNVKAGGSFMGGDGGIFLAGTYSAQEIANTSISKPGYGYLYESETTNSIDVLHDINREKDGAYSAWNHNLPVTIFSHDIYSASGHGIGGMFRPHRGDIGHVHDDLSRSNGFGGSVGAEVNFGNLFKLGFDVKRNRPESHSSKWAAVAGNNLENNFAFRKKADIGPTFEPVYFKNVGEKSVANTEFLPYKEMNEPLRPALSFIGGYFTGDLNGEKLVKSDGYEGGLIADQKYLKIAESATTSVPATTNIRTKRDERNQDISYLTAEEGAFCTNPGDMRSYGIGATYPFNSSEYTNIERKDPTGVIRKPHHITEVSMTNPGGSRYIYGIAAYNNTQEEVTFTNNKLYVNSATCTTGLSDYNTDYYSNKRGESSDQYDGYFNRTVLPSYAYSYLLTGVLSPDYVDVSGNGVTEDDLGNYTSINYTRVNENYKWRTPFDASKVVHDEQLRTEEYDNKANFLYGAKEMWHVQSIETKNYIAEFTIETRPDGMEAYGAVHNASGTGSAHSYRLVKIDLYTKADCLAHTEDPQNRVPIKTVHFQYSNLLCPQIPNHETAGPNNGKLTLTGIYFTYGKSNKGKLSSYEFNYGTNNPSYDIKSYDRWGSYTPNPGCEHTDLPHVNNNYFPYTRQDIIEGGGYKADQHADAWMLKRIKLPSGGMIIIDYEADDYTYVQNKTAMQMYAIKGLSRNGDVATDRLYGSGDDKRWGYNWVHVVLPEGQTCADVTTFHKKFIPAPASDGSRYLFFNFLTRFKDLSEGAEYVRGYAEISYSDNPDNYIQEIGTNKNEYAILVKEVLTEDTNNGSYSSHGNPMAKAAWQYFRLALPRMVYPGSDFKKGVPDGGEVEAAMRSIFGFVFDLVEFIQGANDLMLKKGYANHIYTEKSWVRLNNGNGFKKGGGTRVKRIGLYDKWVELTAPSAITAAMSLSEQPDYGQEYSYTTTDNDGVTPISSGVASYEPTIGNDENAFKQPVMSDKKNTLIPDERFYMEEPFGESFFPSPSVGYSKVTVKNIPHENVTKHATGSAVTEFYTTRDFPTITSRTNTQTHIVKPDWITGITTIKTYNFVTAVQGFQVETNDMNGKPKAMWVYAENLKEPSKLGKLISGSRFFYKTNDNDPSRLNNYVKVIDEKGEVKNDILIGVDAEMIFDTRQHESTVIDDGFQLNTDIMVPFIPIMIPVVLPSYSYDKQRFRSAVTTRIIHKYGILQKVIAYHEGSSIITENIAHDKHTGEVLLSRTQTAYNDNPADLVELPDNRFKDYVYNLNFPAHWAYKKMGQSYQTNGIEMNIEVVGGLLQVPTASNPGVPSGSLASDYLVEGDEVLVDNGSKYWFTDDAGLINMSGFGIPNGNHHIKVVRSGYRNMFDYSIAAIVSKKNPERNISTTPLKNVVWGITEAEGILSAGGVSFGEQWRLKCENSEKLVCDLDYNFDKVVILLNNILAYTEMPNILDGTHEIIPIPNTDESFVKKTLEACEEPLAMKVSRINGPGLRVYDFKADNCFNRLQNPHPFKYQLIIPDDPAPVPDPCEFDTKMPKGIIFQSYLTEASNPEANSGWGEVDVTCLVDVDFGEGCVLPGCTLIVDHNTIFGRCIEKCRTETAAAENPYTQNIKNTWRQERNYVYLHNRQTASDRNLREDGIYTDFELLWDYSGGAWVKSLSDRWTWPSEVSDYDVHGRVIEQRDALNRKSAVVFNDQNINLPAMTANNAERRELMFDGFETYAAMSASICSAGHGSFANGPMPSVYNIDGAVSHTGKQSLRLDANKKAQSAFYARGCVNPSTPSLYTYDSTCSACILPFAPYPGRPYIISGWVKVNIENEDVWSTDTYSTKVILYFESSSATTLEITPSGPIIEGWQRFEKVFTLPLSTQLMRIELRGDLGQRTTWYDDIRVSPASSNMKTMVYDHRTYRLMSELDENNYAAFYEYDEEGMLKRVKKETEKGVMTIKETRTNVHKN